MAGVSLGFYFDRFSIQRMTSVRISFFNLLGMYLIFSRDHIECYDDTVWQPPKPSIHLKASNAKQSLTVSWLVDHTGSVGDIHEIQISRTENHSIIYNKNVSVSRGGSTEYTWTWISDLPLECADHSVRIRNFYNHSVPSPWSNWTTNYGKKAKDKTKLFPSKRVLREGATAMFCCVTPVGVNIMRMTFGNKQYKLLRIGARVTAITVKNLTIPAAFIKRLSLICYETAGKMSNTIKFVSFPPQKPRNLSCATSDMTTVNCTWHPGRERDRYDPNVQTRTLHIQNSDQAPITCGLSSCTFPAVPHMQEYNISVVVKDELGEEMESYSFNISDRVVPVVKWDRRNPGVTNATVSWRVQGNLTQMNLLCQVSTIPDSTTELRCNSVSGLCEVELKHLLPSVSYSTRVRCSVNGRLWGEWKQLIPFTTDPLVTLDLWRRIQQLSDSHDRQVSLLWHEHIVGTVSIQSYTVQWSQEGQIWNRRTVDSGQRQAEIPIGPGKCYFIVQTVFHTGGDVDRSSNPAHITIPPLNDTEDLPVQKRLTSATAGNFNLWWDEQSTITCGYTVEWCILGSTGPCTLQWMKVPEGNNTLFLPASDFQAGRRYTFNIYGCTESGHRLLEIQTGYSKELKSVQSPRLVEPVQSTSSSVTLEWHYNEDDPAQSAFITGYLVTVQKEGSDMLPDLFNVSVADPQSKFVTIEGLQQNQEYAFSVCALTKEGSGPAASITVRTSINRAAHLAKILTPILLLLGCTILLWPQRKRLKEIFSYPTGMNIKAPEFESFLQEADQWLQPLKVEECISCDIEIVNIRPLQNEATTSGDPEITNTMSPSRVPLQADYCPQSATSLCDSPDLQQLACITNRSYFCTAVENFTEPQQATLSEIKSSFEPSDSLQESCGVVYGYISNDTL